ncbi:MAG: hypothetical protein ACI4VO_02860 [Clostridia bacterium]
MEKESQLAYAEVDAILNMLETEAVEKIPLKVREFFKNEKDKKYIPKFSENFFDIDNIELMRETICLLTILDINYWCETEEEKQLILNKLEDNDRIKEEELRERYNPDNIFKNKVNENINSESVALIEYKERSIIKRVFDKIFRFLKRR